MGSSSFVVGDFRGGEWSQTAQGTLADPKYKISLNVSYNALPLESGAHARRPGTQHASTTRGGAPGRVVSFDFKEATPYTMEFTDLYLRFRQGASLITANDAQAVVTISSANPAVVQTTTAHGWTTGYSFVFGGLAANNPLLQNRVFVGTVVDTTHLSLADALTGATIDGSTLGVFQAGTIARVLEVTTPYTSGDWGTLRSVQAETSAYFLHPTYKPDLLSVTALPTATTSASFTLAAAVFHDGPYLDPVAGGTLATPSALIGNITLNLSFPAYDATRSYSVGDYVVSSSVNYKSLTDTNVGNTPASSASNWVATSAADAINGSMGFLGTDTGRMVRLFSEPALWASGATYSANAVVAYGGVGPAAIGATYWIALVGSNTGNIPGADLTKWALYPVGAKWTWGRITGLSTIINRALAGSASIGDMTSGGGLAAAFDGIFSQTASASAESLTAGSVTSLSSYVGKNYSGASDQKIASAAVYPSSDRGLSYFPASPDAVVGSITLNLRAKASLPSSRSDGTLLGTSGAINNTTAPITIVSSDQTTAWKYVWIEQLSTAGTSAKHMANAISQLSFFSPTGSGSSQGVTVQIVGDALLYTTAIRTWRLGLYSDTTGYPACGTYHEGRLWLSGAVDNRIDGSVPIDSSGTLNFAPTASDGTVTDASGIAYTFSSKDVNSIFWMEQDQQGILCGTQAGEWLVQASTANSPLTPTNMQAHRVTKQGSANIEPRRTDHTIVLVQKYQRKVIEYFADVFSGKFSAPDLTEKAKHLTGSGIAELAYQQELSPIIWARMNNGTLIGATYQRDSLMSSQGPTFCGWHRHTLGSGRTVTSIAAGSNSDGTLDCLAMVTLDATTGVYHVENMTSIFEETSALTAAWHLDDGIVPASYTTTTSNMTINGLWHHNGKTVSVFAGGLDLGDYAVASGSLTIPFTSSNALFTLDLVNSYSGAMPIIAGFTYTSQGQLLRPDTQPESGTRNGPGFGKKRRVHKFAAKLVNTLGISFGTTFSRLRPATFTTNGGTPYAANAMFTGIYKDVVDDDQEGFDGMLCWQVTRPFPATVAALAGFLQSEDE